MPCKESIFKADKSSKYSIGKIKKFKIQITSQSKKEPFPNQRYIYLETR